jgi:hypothetical protein
LTRSGPCRASLASATPLLELMCSKRGTLCGVKRRFLSIFLSFGTSLVYTGLKPQLNSTRRLPWQQSGKLSQTILSLMRSINFSEWMANTAETPGACQKIIFWNLFTSLCSNVQNGCAIIRLANRQSSRLPTTFHVQQISSAVTNNVLCTLCPANQ